MDGLTYIVEERDGVSVAVGTFVPVDGSPIYFEMPFTDEIVLNQRVLSLQNLYAGFQE